MRACSSRSAGVDVTVRTAPRCRRRQGWRPTPLNEVGRAQSHRLAARLATFEPRVRRLVSSDLVRARQTAEPIAAALGLDPTFDPSSYRLLIAPLIFGLAPVINTCLDAFGLDRVIWASDWPVCTMGASLQQWIAATNEVVSERPMSEQKKLFHDNAQKFYRL